MSGLVTVGIPVEADAAKALKDVDSRESMGRLISRVALLRQGHDPLAALLSRAAGEARAAGLTDADIDAELAAYNQERRD
jgi:hypothetical protein